MNRELVKQRILEIDGLLAHHGDTYIDWDKFNHCASDADLWLYAVDLAYKRISQPFISASLDGGEVCVEWHKGVAKLMISFYGDGKYSYYYKDGLTEKFCDEHNFKELFFDLQIQPLLESFCEH